MFSPAGDFLFLEVHNTSLAGRNIRGMCQVPGGVKVDSSVCLKVYVTDLSIKLQYKASLEKRISINKILV